MFRKSLHGLDGLLVAPGFGFRGVEGKIIAVKYARENKLPFFGICLGMQMAAIEFARNVLGIADANSTEMNPKTSDPVIDMMEEQKQTTMKGGTMRLGAYPCVIKENTLAYNIYGTHEITERHRHRWEFNNKYLQCIRRRRNDCKRRQSSDQGLLRLWKYQIILSLLVYNTILN